MNQDFSQLTPKRISTRRCLKHHIENESLSQKSEKKTKIQKSKPIKKNKNNTKHQQKPLIHNPTSNHQNLSIEASADTQNQKTLKKISRRRSQRIAVRQKNKVIQISEEQENIADEKDKRPLQRSSSSCSQQKSLVQKTPSKIKGGITKKAKRKSGKKKIISKPRPNAAAQRIIRERRPIVSQLSLLNHPILEPIIDLISDSNGEHQHRNLPQNQNNDSIFIGFNSFRENSRVGQRNNFNSFRLLLSRMNNDWQKEDKRSQNFNWFITKNKTIKIHELDKQKLQDLQKCIICYGSFVEKEQEIEKVDQMRKKQEQKTESTQLIELFCGHIYHKECLINWLKQKPQCPVCRKDFRKHKDYEKWDAQYQKRIHGHGHRSSFFSSLLNQQPQSPQLHLFSSGPFSLIAPSFSARENNFGASQNYNNQIQPLRFQRQFIDLQQQPLIQRSIENSFSTPTRIDYLMEMDPSPFIGTGINQLPSSQPDNLY